MMSRKGAIVLRDVVFMMMMVSAIFVLCGFFIQDMAVNYDNDNMSSEWALTGTNVTGNSMFYDTAGEVSDVGQGLATEATGLYALVSSIVNALDGIGDALFMVMNAPSTIGNLVSGMLEDAGAPSALASMIKWLIVTVFWGVIIFTIISAFLRGGKL
jgi:hypothetical protein